MKCYGSRGGIFRVKAKVRKWFGSFDSRGVLGSMRYREIVRVVLRDCGKNGVYGVAGRLREGVWDGFCKVASLTLRAR